MSLLAILKYLLKHPLNQKNKFAAFWRFMLWQLYKRFFSYPFVYPFTQKCTLIMRRNSAAATNNLYCGLHEYQDMSFLLHFLRPEDTFVDIGANIGSYTILASGHVGAKTICFEPIPGTYKMLLDNIAINHVNDKVEALNVGLAATKGVLKFTSMLGGQNHVALASDTKTVDVPVERLDDIVSGRSPRMIKIDVESYETEVFKAGDETLKDPMLNVIIIEFGSWTGKFAPDQEALMEKFKNNGFTLYRYNPFLRSLELDKVGEDNFLYIRDLEFVKERLRTAEQININGVIY